MKYIKNCARALFNSFDHYLFNFYILLKTKIKPENIYPCTVWHHIPFNLYVECHDYQPLLLVCSTQVAHQIIKLYLCELLIKQI